jgi:hypothetical protein
MQCNDFKNIGDITTILKKCPMAERYSCLNHVNISLYFLSKVASARYTVSILREFIAFFNDSTKQQFILKNILNHKLKLLYQTRLLR